jgi:hypothetical protein
MTVHRTLRIALLTAAVVLSTMAAPEAQRGGGGGGARGSGGMRGGTGMGPAPTRLLALTAIFVLSDEQKKQVKEILDAEYKAAAALREELAKSRETIGLAIRDEQGQSVIDEAVSEYSTPVGAMAAAEMKALAKIITTLDHEAPPSSTAIQTAAYIMRGAFIGKKWDTTPDARFY